MGITNKQILSSSIMASSSEGKVLASLRKGNQLRPGPALCCLCDDPALAKCQTCGQNLCQDCRVAHKKQKSSRDHKLVGIGTDQVVSTSPQVKCDHHNHLDVKYFCSTCIDICCDTCIEEKHVSHDYRGILESVDDMKDMCQDLIKNLRTPFSNIKTKAENAKEARDRRVKSHKELKREITERKHKLIDLITRIADDEFASLTKSEANGEQLFKRVECNVQTFYINCEKALAPVMSVVMGNDVNKVTTCIQHMQRETGNATSILFDIDNIINVGNQALSEWGESLNMVSDIANTVLRVNEINKSDCTISTLGNKSESLKTDSGTFLLKNVHDPIVSDITSIKFIHKTKVMGYSYISKRIYKKHFLCQQHRVYIMSYDEYARELTDTDTLPIPYTPNGRSILTLDDSRYVISSHDQIHMCNTSGKVRSSTHTDGFVPDVITYFNAEKLVTLCSSKKLIRFYSTNNLNVTGTYSLDVNEPLACLHLFVTHNGNIMVKPERRECLLRFKHDGTKGGVVDINGKFFECGWTTACMCEGDKILAAMCDGSVYAFNLNGEQRVIGKIVDNVSFIWNIGIDEEQHLVYVAYSRKDTTSWIAKYKMVYH